MNKGNLMEFISLKLEKQRWGKEVGQIIGEICFDSPNSSVRLKINGGISREMLKLVQHGIVEAAKEVAATIPESITARVQIENEEE
jgi:hypothetical protein